MKQKNLRVKKGLSAIFVLAVVLSMFAFLPSVFAAEETQPAAMPAAESELQEDGVKQEEEKQGGAEPQKPAPQADGDNSTGEKTEPDAGAPPPQNDVLQGEEPKETKAASEGETEEVTADMDSPAAAPANGIPVNLADFGAITGLQLLLNGAPISGGDVTVKDGDTMLVAYSWMLPEGAKYGDYIEVTLPPVLYIANNVTTDIVSDSIGTVGTLYVDQQTRTMRMEFFENVFDQMSKVEGSAKVSTQIKFQTTPGSEGEIVRFPLGDGDYMELNFYVFGTGTINKTGVYLDADGNVVPENEAASSTGRIPSSIQWTIYANPERSLISNMFVTDSQLPTGTLKFRDEPNLGVRVYVVNPDGSETPVPYSSTGIASESDGWTLNGPVYGDYSQGDHVKVNLTSNGNRTNKMYKIVVTVDIYAMSETRYYYNVAKLFGNGDINPMATKIHALGLINFEKNLKKSGKYVEVPYYQDYIEWDIIVNKAKTNIPTGSKFYDQLIPPTGLSDPGHEFTQDSAAHTEIYEYDGTKPVGGNLMGSQFTGAVTNSGEAMEFTYNGADTTKTYLIKTRTYVTNERYYDLGKSGYFNKITFGNWWYVGHVGTAVREYQNSITKYASGDAYAVADKKVDWEIELKPVLVPIQKNDFVLDSYPVGIMEMDKSSFEIVRVDPATGTEEATLLAGSDYRLDLRYQSKYGANVEDGFRVTFLQDMAPGEYHIRYTTAYDIYYGSNGAPAYDYLQNKVSWGGAAAEADYKIPYSAFGKAYKNGSYDVETGLITWSIYINLLQEDLGRNITLTDALGSNQVLQGGITVKRITLDPATGRPAAGGTVFPEQAGNYTLKSKTTTSFEMVFDQIRPADVFEITYQARSTSAAATTFLNSADFLQNTYIGSANRSAGSASVEKGGKQVGDTAAEWTIIVNKSRDVIENLVVTDTMSVGQTYTEGSLKIYNGTQYATAPEDPAAYLQEGVDYTLTVQEPDFTGGGRGSKFVVSFIGGYKTVADKLVLVYTADVNPGVVRFNSNSKPVVTNKVEIAGEGFTQGVPTNPVTVDMSITSAEASGNGKSGYAVFTKQDSKTGAPLAGAEFRLYIQPANGFEPLGSSVTGADGTLNLSNLRFGTYKLVEVAPPAGYTLKDGGEAANSYSFILNDATSSAGKAYTLNILNDPITYSVVVLKTSSETAQPLAGAEFEIKNEQGDAVGTASSGQDGKAVFTGLTAGSYTIAETKAPSGYRLMPVNKEVTLTADTVNEIGVFEVQVSNIPQYTLEILKVSSEDETAVLAGAVFTVSDGETEWQVTTDANGIAKAEGLLAGSYIVTETTAPAGYEPDATPVTVELNGETADSTHVYRHTVQNTPLYELDVLKVDSANEEIVLKGAVFTVTGDAFEQEITTGTDGIAKVENLPAGSYTITETTAPAGYLMDAEPVTLELDAETADENRIVQVRMSNSAIVQSFTLVVEKVDGSNTAARLAGAVFTLEGGGIQPRTITTGQDGTARVEGLAAGNYTLTETKAPAGYRLNTAPMPVEISAQTAEDGIVYKQVANHKVTRDDSSTTSSSTNSSSKSESNSRPESSVSGSMVVTTASSAAGSTGKPNPRTNVFTELAKPIKKVWPVFLLLLVVAVVANIWLGVQLKKKDDGENKK